MNRTPIKIPNKNTRDGSKAAVAKRKAQKRPPGRPLKLTTTGKVSESAATSTEAQKKRKTRLLKHLKARHKMSLLEKLPTELLVEVFLYSMNLNLPRCSPIIAGKLTRELVYTRTIIEAFAPTWEQNFGKHIEDDDMLGSEISNQRVSRGGSEANPSNKIHGDAVLQSALLRCRWASLSILQQSQETWISKFSDGTTFNPLPFLKHLDPKVEKELQKDRLERNLTPATFFEEDYNAFSSYTLQQAPVSNLRKNWNSYVDVAEGLEIPQNLLIGPWTENKIKLLFWLVKGGARVEWLKSTTGEAAMIGFRNAVTAENLLAIHLLFWAGLHDHVETDDMVWVIQTVCRNKLKGVREVIRSWNGSSTDQLFVREVVGEMRAQAEEEHDNEIVEILKIAESELELRWLNDI